MVPGTEVCELQFDCTYNVRSNNFDFCNDEILAALPELVAKVISMLISTGKYDDVRVEINLIHFLQE